MKSLFSPAIALMNRLGYNRKFTLLALIAVIAFATVAYNLYATLDKEVRTSQRELAGLALTKPISQLVRAIQQHRGLVAMATGGGDVTGDEYAAIEISAATAFEETEGKLPPGLIERENWRRIKADWESMEMEQSSMTAEDSFDAHTRLIEKLLVFMGAIADEYALTLDPQIDTYYLIDTAINKLPGALEHIGQLRAYGSGILARKQASEKQRINIYKIIGMLDDANVVLEINLEKTGRHNPVLRSALATASREIADSSHQVVSAIESDILTGRFSMPPGDFFAKATLAVDKGYAQLYDSLRPAAEALLKVRIARAEMVLRASIGIAVLLLLIMAYFAIGIYYSIVGSVQALAHSASAFASGNMRERVCLDTRDELSQIGDSFNEMADGFDVMLNARKQAEVGLQKSLAEQRETNRKLEEAHHQLMQSEKMASIGQLAAGVAHEINNPIGYVHSNLGTLEKYMRDAIAMIEMYEYVEKLMTDDVALARLKTAREKLDIAFLKDDLRALMEESKDGITRVKNIVQNLKDFSHVDASDEWHYSDLRKGLDSTLNIVNNEIKYKASVVKEYGDIPEVECLSSQLNQVFMNLLVNAAHAIEERGTITIRTGAVRTGQQNEEVWVEVADTGKGIAPEHIKKIFDPFFTTKPIGKGTGLGLSLSYGIIQKHHGRIEVQSEAGKGTTFRVWMPVKQPQDELTVVS